MTQQTGKPPALTLIYDGECPFCTRYAALMRVQQSAGELLMLNARDDHPVVKQLINSGVNFDDGMVLMVGETVYHGDQAVHALAMLSSRAGWFNRLNYLLFRSAGLSKILYPPLRFGRNLALRLLGRKKIHS